MYSRIAVAVVLLVSAGLYAWGSSFDFYRSGDLAVGFFNNETGQTVDGLLLEFSGPVEIQNSIGIGGNLELVSRENGVLQFSGDLVPLGTWEVDWLWDGPKLTRAAWLRQGRVVQEIDVHAPTAHFMVVGSMVGDPVRFIALNSRDPDGEPLVRYLWEWDDGVTAEGYEVVRRFDAAGTRSVTLTVQDLEGKTGTKESSFLITSKPTWILVYFEDFSDDPHFESLAPQYVYWDPEQGNYYAKIFDVSSGYGYYVGYSPRFPDVNGTFRIEFDFMIITPNWGNYPRLKFFNDDIILPQGYTCRTGRDEEFEFAYVWSDRYPRYFRIADRTGPLQGPPWWEWWQDWVTSEHPEARKWYHILIERNAPTHTLHWRVTDLENGSVFYETVGQNFDLEFPVNRFYIGMITAPPKYGTWSDIRVDNIVISVWR